MPRLTRLLCSLGLTVFVWQGLPALADTPDWAPPPPQGGYDRYSEPVAWQQQQQPPQQQEAAPPTLEPRATAPARILPIPSFSAERQTSATDIAPEPGAVLNVRGSARPIPLAGPTSDLEAPKAARDLPPMVTAAASLLIVLALFLLVVWVVKRGMPKPVRVLPREALEILGRAQLTGRQQVHLVRCGNKIILLCITPSGVESLTEITDPLEVDRLAGICQQSTPGSATVSFREAIGQYGRTPHAAHEYARSRRDEPDFSHLDFDLHGSRELEV